MRYLFAIHAALVELLYRLAPRGALAVIDLAKVQHVPLDRPPAGDMTVLYDAQVAGAHFKLIR